jgi:hypothetical protein
LYRQLDVYDSTGKLKQKALLDLTSVKGIQVDEQGYLYIVHIPTDGSAFPKREDYADAKQPKRWPMRAYAVSKFAPTGGEPLWSQPWDGDHGMGFIPPNPHCICSTHRVNLIFRYLRLFQNWGCAMRPSLPCYAHGCDDLVWKADGRER